MGNVLLTMTRLLLVGLSVANENYATRLVLAFVKENTNGAFIDEVRGTYFALC